MSIGPTYDEEDLRASLHTVQDMIEIIGAKHRDDPVATALDSLMDAVCQLHGLEHPSGRNLPDHDVDAMVAAAEAQQAEWSSDGTEPDDRWSLALESENYFTLVRDDVALSVQRPSGMVALYPATGGPIIATSTILSAHDARMRREAVTWAERELGTSKPCPDQEGDWYDASGRPCRVKYVNSAVVLSALTLSRGWVNVESVEWATNDAGELEPVPSLDDLRDERAPDALDAAADKIAELCGCSQWDYPGQLVRDVQSVVSRRDGLRVELAALDAMHTNARSEAEALKTGLRGILHDALTLTRSFKTDDVERWWTTRIQDLLDEAREPNRGAGPTTAPARKLADGWCRSCERELPDGPLTAPDPGGDGRVWVCPYCETEEPAAPTIDESTHWLPPAHLGGSLMRVACGKLLHKDEQYTMRPSLSMSEGVTCRACREYLRRFLFQKREEAAWRREF